MELKDALQNYSLDDIRKMAESAATDTKYVLIGKLGSRRITQEGLTGSVSVNDLWAAVAKKSKNAVSPGEVEGAKKAVEKLDTAATQKLKTKGLAKVLHFLPHFFGGIGAGRKKNIQSINSKIVDLKSTHTQAAEVDRISALINSKADLNAEDAGGMSELMRAIGNGYLEVVKLLINNGAAIQQSPRYPESPLERALNIKNFEIAKVLVQAGVDVNSANTATGIRPLEHAIYGKNPEAVEFLLKNHAVPNFYHNGVSPLNLALRNNDHVIAQTLIQGGADVNAISPDTGFTPLISAIYAGNKAAVEFLLDKGADLETSSKVGPPLYTALLADEKEIADLLLEKGANPNAGALASTPLIYLIRKGDREGIDKLIKKGANLNASAAAATPLMAAMETTKNRYYATRLVDAGADINYREPLTHETVLDRACHKGDKADVEFLVGLGASAAPQDVAFRYTPLGIMLFESESPDKWDIAETLITRGPVDLNKFDGDNSTFLNTVITSGNLKAVELILKHGKNIDLNYTDASIPLPLQAALERKSGGHEIAESLIKEGADIKQKDTYGDTSLHRAIQQKRLDNAAFLIARWGGDLTQPVNAAGETPLQLLQASNDPQMKALIPNP
jgi:ankyrin repeat protein